MTTLENRPNTALLVVDVQNGVVAEAHERDAVVANVASLVEHGTARQVSRSSGCSTRTSTSRKGATSGGSSPS